MTEVLPSRSRRADSRPIAQRTDRRRTQGDRTRGRASSAANALRARRKFLKVFPRGFRDQTYLDWERGYKWEAHRKWKASLGRGTFQSLLDQSQFEKIATTAIQIESKTNLLFSFEKMALRDAVRSPTDAKVFALALFDLLYGSETMDVRFGNWISCVDQLPRRPGFS